MRFFPLLVIAAGLIAACEDPAQPPVELGDCSTAPGREVQVGTAPRSGEGFLAFEEGAEVEMATAGQGGYHVFLNLALRGYQPRGLFIDRSVYFAVNGERITRTVERLNLAAPAERNDESYCTLRTPQIAVVCPTPLGRVENEDLEIEVQIEDVVGKTATVRRLLHAVCPPDEEQDDEGRTACSRICDGVPVE